jgi:hypothetical protein
LLDLTFRLEGAAGVPFAATPQMAFAVRVSTAGAIRSVHSALLRCQIQIDASARAYTAHEKEALRDLFGDGPVWGRAVGRVLWAHATAVVPAFSGETQFEVHAPCTYDLCVASAKYFHALQNGDVPVAILFSGTVFHAAADGALQAAPVPWSAEARWAVPARVWQETLEHYYAGRAALPLSKDVVDRLGRYKTRSGLPTWDAAIESLLPPDPGAAR